MFPWYLLHSYLERINSGSPIFVEVPRYSSYTYCIRYSISYTVWAIHLTCYNVFGLIIMVPLISHILDMISLKPSIIWWVIIGQYIFWIQIASHNLQPCRLLFLIPFSLLKFITNTWSGIYEPLSSPNRVRVRGSLVLSLLPSLTLVMSHEIVLGFQEEIFGDNRQRSSHVPLF